MHSPQKQPEHREVAELIPWYLNGTLGARQRQRVDTHVVECAICRNELAQERRIYQAMSADAAVEHFPAASLRRLQAQINELGEDGIENTAPAPPRAVFRGWRAAAASVAVLAVGATLMRLNGWIAMGARDVPASYHTATAPQPRAPGEVIRAVFSPSLTLLELQAILDEAQLRIVSGPTEAGVYSLAANSGRSVSSSLALLRRHAAVRFAESIEQNHQSDDSAPMR